jgi:AcrR family transcriptional regulator
VTSSRRLCPTGEDAGLGARNAPGRGKRPPGAARERILDAAYELFSQQGIGAVGVDAIIARSGTAKMSLYRHFRCKEDLVLAFLEERAERWTFQWLEAEVLTRSDDPEARLLAIFDVFDGWFQLPDFEGCSFINVLLEHRQGTPVHRAAADRLAEIRSILRRLADAAGLADPARFAQTWHFLMKGCIVTACEGHRAAAKEARQAGELILAGWPRQRAA